MTRGFFTSGIGGVEGNFKNDAILIVVDQNSLYLLGQAGGLSLLPELLARAGPVVSQPRFDAEAECLFVHECEHEDLLCFGMLGYAGDDSLVVEFRSQIGSFFNLFNAGSFGK